MVFYPIIYFINHMRIFSLVILSFFKGVCYLHADSTGDCMNINNANNNNEFISTTYDMNNCDR
jgi:hypothetical protein